MSSDRGLKVAEVVFEPVSEHFVVPVTVFCVAFPGVMTGAVQGKHARSFCKTGPMSGKHASLAGGKVLGGVEAERDCVAGRNATCRTGADGASFIAGSSRVGGVFDHMKAMLLCESPDRIHVARQPAQVHRQDRPRPTRDALFNLLHTDVTVGSDIGKHRSGSDVQNRMYGRAKRHGARDHFLARSDL